MTKYEIIRDLFEYRQPCKGEPWTEAELRYFYEYDNDNAGNHARTVGSYGTLAEAERALAECEPSTYERRAGAGYVIEAEVYILQENVYIDGTDDYEQGDVLVFKCAPYVSEPV